MQEVRLRESDKNAVTEYYFIAFQQWEDENLSWNVTDHNGIRSMRIPAQEVWLPDTFIFNKYVLFVRTSDGYVT